MNISIPKEVRSDEKRVSLTPQIAQKCIDLGYEVVLEEGAGNGAHFNDEAYKAVGVKIASSQELWSNADILIKVNPPSSEEVSRLKPSSVLIGFLNPLGDTDTIQSIQKQKVTAFSFELVPRVSRAQSMDALSSQANIGGYRAVLLASEKSPKFFPMLTTAAGTIPPAKVLIIGVGVAGLQAIATARRLGAVVEAYDIRPEVKEQVQSLGATFVEAGIEETSSEGGYAKEVTEETKKKLQEALLQSVAKSDVVITTAQVPGKKAPVLVTNEMLKHMAPGSIVIDMAAEQGGNVEATESGKEVDFNGINVVGPSNLPSGMPIHASELYSKNVLSLMKLLTKDGSLNLNFEDEIIQGACVCHEGEIKNERVKALIES